MKIKQKNNHKVSQRKPWSGFIINKQSQDSKSDKYILIGRGFQNQEKKK